MKVIKTALIFAIALGGASSCKFAESPSAALAKEMCSCLFVAEQTEKYCRMVTKESRILAKWEPDYNKKEVWSRGANFRSMARLDDEPRYGCQIQIIEKDPEVQNRHNDRHNDR